MVSGTYPPMVKCFEVSELSMKFQRNLDCEIVDFVLLDDDWKKMAFLLADRVVEIHAQVNFPRKLLDKSGAVLCSPRVFFCREEPT